MQPEGKTKIMKLPARRGSAGGRLLALLVDVASGSATWGEVLDEGDEVMSRLGQSF